MQQQQQQVDDEGLGEKKQKFDASQTGVARKVGFYLDAQELGDADKPKKPRKWSRSVARSLTKLKEILADWLFLLVLGILCALINIFVDMMIYYLQEIQRLSVSFDLIPSFLTWSVYTIGLVTASATFVHYVAVQAIGSGIPEMKTVIRGVVLKDYLSFRTLVSKVFGITMALASGIPIGKMGPFTHIASIVANQMSNIAGRFHPAFADKTRRMEALSAACAVGVASTFSSPVGGVLFSIEVTTMYFSVRSYWRGFFAACCAAVTIRLLRGYVVATEVTTAAFYQTSFVPSAFVVSELPIFAVLGLLCGFTGALYIVLYRNLVLFLRNNSYAKKLFQRHWIVYPLVFSSLFAALFFPQSIARYCTGTLKFGANLRDFFSNCTFLASAESPFACHNVDVLQHWLRDGDVLTHLLLFAVVHFIFSIIALTLPVPSGCFLPVFVLGGSIGRLYGETMTLLFPKTVLYPGVYAVVGAAGFSASVTHTVSTSVMIFEITGQLHFILPVMIAVLIANAICAYLTPSLFDTIIQIKHLPFLPDLPPTSAIVHQIVAENIMVTPVLYVTKVTSYDAIRKLLLDGRAIRTFPVVDSQKNQILIGTVPRYFLMQLLESQIGVKARRMEAERRVRNAIEMLDAHFRNSEDVQNEINERKIRTSSDSKLISLETRLNMEEGESVPRKKSDAVPRKHNRFLIVPTNENELSLHKKKESTWRRNAMFQVGLEAADNKIGVEDANSEHSADRVHRTVHSLSTDVHSTVKRKLTYIHQAKKYLHMMQFGYKKDYDELKSVAYDLNQKEREEWEQQKLDEQFELTDEDIDPAPYQLVKKTSLYRIHTIFSMLQLNIAFVTDCGKLIGCVALSDVRRALEETKKKKRQEAKDVERPTDLNGVTEMFVQKLAGNVVDILTPMPEVVNPEVDEVINIAAERNEEEGGVGGNSEYPRSMSMKEPPRETISASVLRRWRRKSAVDSSDRARRTSDAVDRNSIVRRRMSCSPAMRSTTDH